MKYLFVNYLAAFFVFFITLSLTPQSTANPQAASVCTPSHNAKTCASEVSPDDHAAAMNSLFPEKQPLTKLTVRPGVVALISPKFLSQVTGSTKLAWKAAPGANAYHIQIATDPNFKWLIADEHFISTTSYEFTKAEAGNRYFWRVAAFNSDNEAMFMKSNFVSSVFTVK